MSLPLELAHTPSEISASIIWLHGLGADGYDFAPIVEKLDLKHIRFILPHAPKMPVTLNNGYVMPAWYDIYGTTGQSEEDAAGIRKTQTYINSLIEKEVQRGIPSERIAIAGFSQGGAIALQTALRHPHALAGALALSTYLPLKASLEAEATSANKAIPIFMAHGTFDDIIPLTSANTSLALLQTQQYSVDFHEYPMAHSVCENEIADIKHFLNCIFPT